MIPYYENPNMLREHIKHWKLYSKEITEKLLVIIIDDGSPRNPAESVLKDADLPFELQLYRIKENIPWNYTGARNLGFHVAPQGWVLTTDIDHIVEAESMDHLFKAKLDEGRYYHLERYMAIDGKIIRPHGISFVITREMFWRAGGFNEDYAGQRSKAAGVFRHALRRVGRLVTLKGVYLIWYNQAIISDCRTSDWPRTPSPERRKMEGKRYLRFTWERIL